MGRMRIRWRLGGLLLLLTLAAAGCAGGGSPPESPTGTATGAAPDVAPLTGTPPPDGADLDRPAVAIKVSDVPEAHPQTGVDRADIVFVEPLGTSYTRLAAVFHSDLPEQVGPVRSVRPVDAPLLGPLSPVFGNTMGAQWVVDYVDSAADVEDLGSLRVSGSGAYVQDADRVAPNHVLARPEVLLELAERSTPPQPYVAHAADAASASAASAGQAGTSVVVPYGPSWDVSWTYDEATARYLRDQPWGPHVLADGTRVSSTNVLVLEVDAVTQKIGGGAGAPVPIPQLVDGSGRFVALAGGASVQGTWTKDGVNEPFELRTDSGEDLLLAPGNTWVELPAPSAGVTTS
jgi:hypothetical protein